VADRDAALTYALRGRVVGKYLGQLGLMLAVLTLVPLAVSLVEGETGLSWRYLHVVLVLAAVGAPLARIPPPERIRESEALAVVALAFVASALVMTWPFTAAGLPFTDALFETVSGVTTTGLSTVADPQTLPRTFRFARAWMQWYGGLGIAVLSVALLMGHQAAARRLVDVPGAETLAAATRTHARRMLTVYLVLTCVGVVAVLLTGADVFTAGVHVLAAVSTGGFSPYVNSLAGLPNGAARGVLTALSFCGAVSLPLYWAAFHRGAGGSRAGWRVLGDPELKALAALAAVVAVVLALSLHLESGLDWPKAVAHALFMGVSAQTTTGFASLPVAGLSATALAVMIVAMTAGGSVGSTAGGVKLLRVLILANVVRTALRTATAPPHAVLAPRLGGREIEPEDTVRALALIALFAGVVLASWLPFLAQGYDPLEALFEVVSATGTVGLSTGITSAALSTPLKGVLMADMLLGRVEIVALLVLLYPRTWFGRRG
jgi:trk system potassium uptake protein TrkH